MSLSTLTPMLQRPSSAENQVMDLRLAATANDTYASAYYAQDKGFFSRARLNVNLQTFSNGAAIAAAIVGGAIDIGVSTPISIANAYLHGFPLAIVAAGSLSDAKVRLLLLCISSTSAYKTAKDLEGKTVAVNALKTGSELALDCWLAQGGADISKVKVVETNFSDMGASLERGSIAAAVLSEPALSLALKQNGIQVLGDPNAAIAPRYLNSCWFATREFAQNNSELLRRFNRGIYEAQNWANTHQAESGQILAKYAKLDIDLIRNMARCPYADQLRISDVQPFLDQAAKYGTITRPVSAADLIYRK
jgi:NitT/TauT family transport system substrate-binding protein